MGVVGLSAAGTLAYNGYSFLSASTKLQSNTIIIYDEAGRFPVAHEIELHVVTTIAGTVTGTSTTDAQLTDIRRLLTQPGRTLICRDMGLGLDLTINAPGGQPDIEYGPKPEIVSWRPVGSNKVVEIEWVVKTRIKPCVLTTTIPSLIKAFNFGVTWDIDHRKLTTRRIHGYYEIAANQIAPGTRFISASADEFRNKFVPPEVEGFHRRLAWNLNYAKNRMEFTIVDEEIPTRNAFPIGIANIQARHEVVWSRSEHGSKRFRNIITARIEPFLKTNPKQAWAVFAKIVRERINIAKKASQHVFVDEVRVSEDIFGTECEFMIGYRYLSTLKKLIEDAGLWEPVLPGHTWKQWIQYQEQPRIIPRKGYGMTPLPHFASMDVLINVCNPGEAVFTESAKGPEYQEPDQDAVIRNETPPPDKSWIDYKQDLLPHRERAVVRQPILQPQDSEPFNDQDMTASRSFDYGQTGGTPDIIQVSGRSRYFVDLVGHATRVGHKIPRPFVQKIGGQDATEVASNFRMSVLGNFFGVPVYTAVWKMRYALPSAPAALDPPVNLAEFNSNGSVPQPVA